MPMRGGGSIIQHTDERITRESIEQISKKDADAYFAFYDWVGHIADIMGPLLMKTPPHLGSKRFGDIKDVFQLGWSLRKHVDEQTVADITRLFTMSATDLLERWFETPQMKGFMSVNGIIGTWAGPDAPGTAYVLMHHSVGDIGDGEVASWGFMEGGMGAVAKACENSAKFFGAEVRVNAGVKKISTNGGRVTGVVLESGEEISASTVLSSVDAHQTFLNLLEPGHLPSEFEEEVRRYKFRGSSGKVNLALEALPNFTCLPGVGEHLRGAISFSPAVDYMERAYDDAKYGHFSRRPYIDTIIPTLVDPSMAPPGKHVMSCFVQYAPYHLAEGEWDDEAREAFGETVIDTIAERAPNIRDIILHKQVLTPLDIERDFGLTEGNIFQGELSLEQLFFNRPVPGWARYRTPIKDLWMCGSATHPGGGIMGAPGRIAALELLGSSKAKKAVA
jgi:phytoene dehydrogenase-like protein